MSQGWTNTAAFNSSAACVCGGGGGGRELFDERANCVHVMNSQLANSLQTHTAVRGHPSSTLRCVSQSEHQETPAPKGGREREGERERDY